MVIYDLAEFVEIASGYPELEGFFHKAVAEENWDLANFYRKTLNKQYYAMQRYRRQFERAKRYGPEVYALPIEFVD